jgi:hypothetical protein
MECIDTYVTSSERKIPRSEAVSSPAQTARPLDEKSGVYPPQLLGPFCALRDWNFGPSLPAPREGDGKCVL